VVAETFLRRWFGRKPTAPAADEARAEIDRLLADRPNYRGPLTWLRTVLDELVPTPGYLAATLPQPEAAREKLSGGVPLLRGLPLTVGRAAFARRWKWVCEALGDAQPAGLSGRAAPDEGAVASALIDWKPDPLREVAERAGADPALVATVARFVLFPGFVPLADSAAPLLQGVRWERGDCPVCGSLPLLGEFRGLDQSRHMRCGLCATSWVVPRQWCPACDNRDHGTLGFLSKEGEETRYRVATCDACRSGVKMLSTLSALPPLMLLVADAATLHLDLAVADRGYLCPPAPHS
jgi:FdhE protein